VTDSDTSLFQMLLARQVRKVRKVRKVPKAMRVHQALKVPKGMRAHLALRAHRDSMERLASRSISPPILRQRWGAVAATDVPYAGVRCTDNSGYLVMSNSAVIPNLMNSSYSSGTKTISLRASKIIPKSGTTSTMWFNAKRTLSPAVDIAASALPTELNIVPGGYAGNGQKVYVRFNGRATTCAYQSHANTVYKSRYCATGATETPGVAGSGLTGGVAVDLVSGVISGVSSIEIEVNGSSSRYVTTVDFSVIHK
jgi:hypothetical protein